ncbi:MAG: hypothetical protein H6828_03570 [Planctomycetes bacterium]|nr:hypothetical protein [Planctomycetota bacterium]
MSDIAGSDFQLDSAWRSFGSTLSAGVGALVALISLFADVPLATACGRGALALVAVQLVTRVTAAALARTSARSAPPAAKPQDVKSPQKPKTPAA